jgi:hypothetical protein
MRVRKRRESEIKDEKLKKNHFFCSHTENPFKSLNKIMAVCGGKEVAPRVKKRENEWWKRFEI